MFYTELIIGGLAFSSFLIIFWMLRKKFSQEDIIERVKSAGVAGTQGTSGTLRKQNPGAAYEAGVSDLFDLATGMNRSEYKIMFEQAGWNPKNAQRNIILTKMGLSLAMMVPAIFLVVTIPKLVIQPAFIRILIVVGAGIAGIFLFDKFMQFMINARYNRISKDLHSAVELLVVCSKAGMGIDKGMERVSQEVSQYNLDLGREFLLTSIELEVMPNRKVAYENLRRRVNLPLIYGMTTTLIQAEEQGSSVSESLRVLSDEFRTQVLMNFERKAAKLPATLSIPVVLFTLPTLMAVILGPAIIKLLNDTNLF
jgi:tight adherence protein C